MWKQHPKVFGGLDTVISVIWGYSEEHRRFLKAGYKCQQCDARLRIILGVVTANYYAMDGRRTSRYSVRVKADTVECPQCGHRWKLYGAYSAAPSSVIEVLDIVETERIEEFCGEDLRVIDNSESSTPLTRHISFSKEWSKSCHVDFERTQSDGAELTIGAKDTAWLKLSSEEKLRQAYSVSQDTKETCTEEVSCEVAASRSSP